MKSATFILGLLLTGIAFMSFDPVHHPVFATADKSCSVDPDPTGPIIFYTGRDNPEDPEEEVNELFYEIRGSYSRPITMEKLIHAHTLSDIIPYYPASWIEEYESVEISATCDGQKVSVQSPTAELNTEQKNMLTAIDLGTEIFIKVDYRRKNMMTGEWENNQMNVTMTVLPRKEAVFPGGHEQLMAYLQENSKYKISSMKFDQLLEKAYLHFTISEEGAVEDVVLKKTSGNLEMDALAVDLINKMPPWQPAENYKGERVRQEFDLLFGSPAGGC